MALEKATIRNCFTNESISVQFNPEEYTLTRGNNFAQASVFGLSGPVLQFVHGDMQTLEMELFMDTYEAGRDVRDETAKIVDLMEFRDGNYAPPPVVFSWGKLSFTCVLAKVVQRYILFRPDGTPVRARLQVTFNEYINPEIEARETKRETADYSRLFRVGQGETLSDIAGRMLGDPTLWRVIALHNGLDDPRDLPLGAELHIPPLPYTDPESGEVMR